MKILKKSLGKFQKGILIGLIVFVVIMVTAALGAVADRLLNIRLLDKISPRPSTTQVEQRIISEEEGVVKVVEKVGPSVVTISAASPVRPVIQFSPFGGISRGTEGGTEEDIGTGFVVSDDGLVVTNKHVVSNTSLSYKVSTSDGKTYDVVQISRDPGNDIAVLKINSNELRPVTLGDSSNLQVGQFVIAIGTALGEFRNTVTTGVISGLGRGINAGSMYQGYVEHLDDVIQTDAAINSGNSGGPLLNSAGEVIGINVAVARSANNVAFAIPINVVKDSLAKYHETGSFPSKAYLGIEYQMLTQQTALLNQVPQGAYVINVVVGSPAEKAGVGAGDIIFKVDGNSFPEDGGGLAKVVADKKEGDQIKLSVWRSGDEMEISATLSASP